MTELGTTISTRSGSSLTERLDMHLFVIMRILCVLSGLALMTACDATTEPEENTPAPVKQNVVMIIVDDLNDWVGAMGGHPDTKTPNIDQLAAEGMLFTNAHATAAICGPSRASVMTGLRPSTSGIYGQLSDKDIKNASAATKDITFMSDYFAQHGYKTMGIGKIFHNGAPEGSFQDYGERIKGFGPHPEDEFVWDSDKTNTDWGVYPENDEDMIDYKSAMWAMDKLKEDHEKPFFLTVGFIRPHVPWYAPQKWFDMHPADEIAMSPTDSPRNNSGYVAPVISTSVAMISTM